MKNIEMIKWEFSKEKDIFKKEKNDEIYSDFYFVSYTFELWVCFN